MSSFSSSLLDSSSSSSTVLGASILIHQKDERPIQGKAKISNRIWGGGSDDDDDDYDNIQQEETETQRKRKEDEDADNDDKRMQKILQQKKRFFHPPTPPDNSLEEEEEIEATTTATKKTELEMAVLRDCLSTNFLFAHHFFPTTTTKSASARTIVDRLMNAFEKVRYRKNEIIMRQNDPTIAAAANSDDEKDCYFYILFAGEIQTIHQRIIDGRPMTIIPQQQPPTSSTLSDEGVTNNNNKYTVFGEMSLLTGGGGGEDNNNNNNNDNDITTTIKSITDPCICFRLHQTKFRQLVALQQQQLYPTIIDQDTTTTSKNNKDELIKILQKSIPIELANYLRDDEVALHKLISGMTTISFKRGDILYTKGSQPHAFVIVIRGLVKMIQITMGGRPYEDIMIGPGYDQTSFGWLTLEENESLPGTIIAVDASDASSSSESASQQQQSSSSSSSNNNNNNMSASEQEQPTHIVGQALVIPKDVFLNVLGGPESKCGKSTLRHIAEKRLALLELQQITIFRDSALDMIQLNGLLDLMHPMEFYHDEIIIARGNKIEPAIYFVRQGSVIIEKKNNNTTSSASEEEEERFETIHAGGYFGEKNMLLDQNKMGNKHYSIRSPITVTARSSTSTATATTSATDGCSGGIGGVGGVGGVISGVVGTNTTAKAAAAAAAAATTRETIRLDVLYLEECRKVVDTTLLGLGGGGDEPGRLDGASAAAAAATTTVSSIDPAVQLCDLTRHALLGSGSFGQVWLASTAPTTTTTTTSSSTANATTTTTKKKKKESEEEVEENYDVAQNEMSSQRQDQQHCEQQQQETMTATATATATATTIVALKVQAKHQLVQSPEQAQRVVAERNIMASLRSSFIIRLYNSFQDQHRLYMITSLLQGGELESLIPHDGLSENTAKFYAAGILEGLTYLHRRHIIHRDVKTANVLLNSIGYPVLIDFGFAKYVPDKTFTFCGSAMYTAPEIIRYKGHDKGCDHWSWAVLVYRMVTGRYPFYKKGMDELSLYKQICKGTFELDGTVSMEFRHLMVSILYPDPTQRLGSRHNGWRDIFNSSWFTASSLDMTKLRRQQLPAPWIPDLKDPMDASRFHHNATEVDDLMTKQRFPKLGEKQQEIFRAFGPYIEMVSLEE